jgi:hypothetical protein
MLSENYVCMFYTVDGWMFTYFILESWTDLCRWFSAIKWWMYKCMYGWILTKYWGLCFVSKVIWWQDVALNLFSNAHILKAFGLLIQPASQEDNILWQDAKVWTNCVLTDHNVLLVRAQNDRSLIQWDHHQSTCLSCLLLAWNFRQVEIR